MVYFYFHLINSWSLGKLILLSSNLLYASQSCYLVNSQVWFSVPGQSADCGIHFPRSTREPTGQAHDDEPGNELHSWTTSSHCTPGQHCTITTISELCPWHCLLLDGQQTRHPPGEQMPKLVNTFAATDELSRQLMCNNNSCQWWVYSSFSKYNSAICQHQSRHPVGTSAKMSCTTWGQHSLENGPAAKVSTVLIDRMKQYGYSGTEKYLQHGRWQTQSFFQPSIPHLWKH